MKHLSVKRRATPAKPGKLTNLLLAYTVQPRRPLDDDQPNGYHESLRDWAMNNAMAVEWFLENHAAIQALLSSHAGLVGALAGLRNAAMNTPVLDSSKDWTVLIEQADAALKAANCETPQPSKPLCTCDDCGAKVETIIGCPDGAEICQDCFDAGAH